MTNGDLRKLGWVRTLAKAGTARVVRIGANVSEGEIARTLGCHVSTVGRWERGLTRPTGDLGVRYARLLAALMAGQQ